MVIDRIYIHSFGALRREEMTFDAGLNIIEGENESGKTTVATFIRFLFYGFQDQADAARYLAFSDGLLAGSLECTVRDEDGSPLRYRISRVLEPTEDNPDDVTGHAEIRRLDTNELLHEGEVPGEVFFGVSADVFSSTAFVRQVSAGGTAGDNGTAVGAGTVQDAVSRILFAANEEIDPQAAADTLNAQREKLYDPAARRGRIYEMEKERTALAASLDAAKSPADNRSAELRRAAAECEKRIDEDKERIAQLSEICGQVRCYQTVSDLAGADELMLRRASAKKRADTLSASMFRNGYIPDTEFAAALHLCADDMNAAAREQAEGKESLQKLEFSARRDNVKEDLLRRVEVDGGVDALQKHTDGLCTKRSVSTVIGVIVMIFAVLAVVITIFLLIMNAQIARQCIFISAILCVAAGTKFYLRSRYVGQLDVLLERYHCETEDELENFFEEYLVSEDRFHHDSEEKESVRTAISSARLRYDEAVRQAAMLLNRLQPPGTQKITAEKLNAEIIGKAADRIDKTLSELDRMNGQIAVCDAELLSMAETCGIHAEDAEQAYNAMREAKSALADTFNGQPADALDTHEAEAQIARLQETVHTFEEQLAAIREQLRDEPEEETEAPQPAADPKILADLIGALDERLKNERRTYAALSLAAEKLQSASTRLHDEITPRLMDSTGRLMQTLSDQKYTAFAMDGSQQFTYRSADTGDAPAMPVDFLSAGTQDLAYLSLRMSLTRMLFRREMPPLLFDEAFATLDDKRLDRMIALLFSATAPDKSGIPAAQALVFTCHERERSAAEAVNPCRVIRLTAKA
ncbi:MAG: AAA family ATPase [Clostridia bacterium]|nr:AAA family ATPase [Clostridia bacterium]